MANFDVPDWGIGNEGISNSNGANIFSTSVKNKTVSARLKANKQNKKLKKRLKNAVELSVKSGVLNDGKKSGANKVIELSKKQIKKNKAKGNVEHKNIQENITKLSEEAISSKKKSDKKWKLSNANDNSIISSIEKKMKKKTFGKEDRNNSNKATPLKHVVELQKKQKVNILNKFDLEKQNTSNSNKSHLVSKMKKRKTKQKEVGDSNETTHSILGDEVPSKKKKNKKQKTHSSLSFTSTQNDNNSNVSSLSPAIVEKGEKISFTKETSNFFPNSELNGPTTNTKKRKLRKSNLHAEEKIENQSEGLSAKQNKFRSKLSAMMETTAKPQQLSLRQRMMDQLRASRFRYLNEQIYTNDSSSAVSLFKEDPAAFKAYHTGYQQQVKKWPMNPLDKIIKSLSKMTKELIVADLGCGEGRLAKEVPQTVHSFDLIAANDNIIACDMANLPLESSSVNVVVFCLSLMGTNLRDYLYEANRILNIGGILKIAEVESRFDPVDDFIKGLQRFGFKLTSKDLSHNLFYFLDFRKETNVKKTNKLPTISLHPCLYKKR